MEETPFTVIRACRDIQTLPDGEPITQGLAHTLLVLATYYPNVHPSLDRLCSDLKLKDRSSIIRRLQRLEDAGLIRQRRRKGRQTTEYTIVMWQVRKCCTGFTPKGRGCSDADFVVADDYSVEVAAEPPKPQLNSKETAFFDEDAVFDDDDYIKDL